MKYSSILCAVLLTLAASLFVDRSTAQEKPQYVPDVGIDKDNVTLGKKEYSPYLHRAYPDKVLWGDTHLHTSYSTDAGMVGNFLGPDEAFRLARDETVRASAGERVKLIRPPV